MIPFNKTYLTGKESHYISEVLTSGKLSGDGLFTKKCHAFFEKRYGFKKSLLTTSCTDALEMAAILLDFQPGDEVIMPSYTFVSTANAFALRGARIVFADSMSDHPNIDANKIESLITSKTKAIVVVHYAGMACDMDLVMQIASKYNLFVVEDAAQAIDNYHISSDGNKRALGSIGHLAAFSFHETKNIISGEGGMLVVNDEQFIKRAEIIWEKGTNRASFWRGEIDKYGWVDIGSSFLPAEIIAAFLWAQLEYLEDIQSQRLVHWDCYYDELAFLEEKGIADRPLQKAYSTNNGHMFYLVFNKFSMRAEFIDALKLRGIQTVFHYNSLHDSSYFKPFHDGTNLFNSNRFSEALVRLPLYYEVNPNDVIYQIKNIFS